MIGSWRITSNETIQYFEREGWCVVLTAPDGHQYDIFLTPEFLDAQQIFEPEDGDIVRMFFLKSLAQDPITFRRIHGIGSNGLVGEVQRLRGQDERVTKLVWSVQSLFRESRDRRDYPRHLYQAPVAITGLAPGAGVTTDISRSGVRVLIAGWVSEDAEGHPCAVRFMGLGDQVKPEYAGGVVRRVCAAAGTCEVSIAFDKPLRVLNLSSHS